MTRYVSSIGGYLPLLRCSRALAAASMRWAGAGGAKGARAVAGWDEDALTMAIEASRGPAKGGALDALVFASTSAHFLDRPQAALALDALALARTTFTQDVANSRRCATSALLQALRGTGDTLVVAGEKRTVQAGSAELLGYGDGAAACRIGDTGAVAFRGGASITHDFIDSYTSREHPHPYAYEARFIREIAVEDIVAPAISAALKDAGVAGDAIAYAAVHEPVAGAYGAAAKRVGLRAPNLAADLAQGAGDLGAAHPLFAFGLALASAQPGDLVLLAGFGGGCDAMVFEVREPGPGSAEFPRLLEEGRELADFTRFLYLTGCLDIDWGMRAEAEIKAQATVLDRHGRDIMGFIGGRDSKGVVQFPKSSIPVNPAVAAPERLEDVRLAEEIGGVVSITADRLTYYPDPPFEFGLVQFDNGARVMMEFTDRGEETLAVGDRVRMRFRIKSIDRRRGFRTYFWKAAPIARPALRRS